MRPQPRKDLSRPQRAEVAILKSIIVQPPGKTCGDSARLPRRLRPQGRSQQASAWHRAKGLAVVENIISGNHNLRAVFAGSDKMDTGAIEALKSAGQVTG